jgi:hypothetical protein
MLTGVGGRAKCIPVRLLLVDKTVLLTETGVPVLRYTGTVGMLSITGSVYSEEKCEPLLVIGG